MKNPTTLRPEQIRAFCRKIYAYYRKHKRPMPWRDIDDPYRVLVSEIMLHQTQVPRVLTKYPEFIAAFPTVKDLADASLRNVLAVWQGMGYNRRALMLKRLAETVVRVFAGTIPREEELLRNLPGIGPYTAAAMRAFAFDQPAVFIETNIRSVFIDEFFARSERIHDREILPMIEITLDRKHPRQWYYALMDYGAMLKATKPNPGRKSYHHTRQSKFEGSDRQIRGKILRLLVECNRFPLNKLIENLLIEKTRAQAIIRKLSSEKLIHIHCGVVILAGDSDS